MTPAISNLVDALKAEFEDDVIFAASIPSVITPPAVIVAPSDPFIEPATHGGVTEHWDVLVAVSMKEPGLGIDMMRELSLRVRRTVVKQGATWKRATGPRRLQQPENAQIVASVNVVDFKYPDPEI